MAQLTAWSCRACHAEVDAGFALCWRCGTSIDGLPDASFTPVVETLPASEHCDCCGYDLRAIDSSLCPECGQPFEREVGDTPVPAIDPRSRRNTCITVLIAGALMFTLALTVAALSMLLE